MSNYCIDSLTNSSTLSLYVRLRSATAVIPREYLPKGITKFNAYAIHGDLWGEASPKEENKSYESLYPADPAVSGKIIIL